MFTSADERAAVAAYGMRMQAGLALAYPDLAEKTHAIYSQRIAKLPWVPKSWLPGVEELQRQFPDDLVLLSPALRANGSPSTVTPLWLDTPEKLEHWQKIFTDVQSAVQAYARKQQEEGAATLRSLYADAAFWDAAYKVGIAVRDAPGKAIGAVSSGIFSAGESLVKGITGYGWKGWLVLGVAGFLVWKYRSKLLPGLPAPV